MMVSILATFIFWDDTIQLIHFTAIHSAKTALTLQVLLLIEALNAISQMLEEIG